MTGFVIKQWMEKKPSGVFIFRNDRAEDREARKHSNSKHKSMDLLISKVQTQFEEEMEGRVFTRDARYYRTDIGIYNGFKCKYRHRPDMKNDADMSFR